MARWGPDLRGAEMRYLPLLWPALAGAILMLCIATFFSIAFAATSIAESKTPKAKAGPLHDRAFCENQARVAMNAQKAPVGHPAKIKPAGGAYEACMRKKGRQP